MWICWATAAQELPMLECKKSLKRQTTCESLVSSVLSLMVSVSVGVCPGVIFYGIGLLGREFNSVLNRGGGH